MAVAMGGGPFYTAMPEVWLVRLVGKRQPWVAAKDIIFELLRRLTVLNGAGERHMKLVGQQQRCAALDGKLGERVSCTIYELRPSGCRAVVPGSKECRRDRRERGIDG